MQKYELMEGKRKENPTFNKLLRRSPSFNKILPNRMIILEKCRRYSRTSGINKNENKNLFTLPHPILTKEMGTKTNLS